MKKTGKAKEDFKFVYGYIKREKSNRPMRSVEDLRIEATKIQAERRGVTTDTVRRNLKIFWGIDLQMNIKEVDPLIEQALLK